MKLSGIRAIGVIVTSLENRMADYTRLVGVPSWSVSTLREEKAYINGRRTSVEYELACGQLAPGLSIELIQPCQDGSLFHTQLVDQGEGVVYLEVDGSAEALTDLHVRLVDGGDTVSQQIGNQAWYDTRADLGGWYLKSRMSDSEGQPDPAEPAETAWMRSRHLLHLGLVVDDVFRETGTYAEMLGVGQWDLYHWRAGEGSLNDPFFRGEPVEHQYLSATASLGSTGLELVQPTQGPSDYVDFRDARGPGVHHLYLSETEEGRDEWPRLLETLPDFGLQLSMGSSLLDGVADFAYVDTAARLGGLTIEIAAMRPGKTLSEFVPTCSLDLQSRVRTESAR